MESTFVATITEEASKNAPDIIRAASERTLGILALMILALSVLAAFLLGDASHQIRAMIIIFFCAGVAVYAYVITRESQLRPSVPIANVEAKPVEVKPLLSNPEWLVFIGQYDSEAEAKRKQQQAAAAGYPNSEIFRQGRYFHLRFRFASQQEAQEAADKLKKARVSHEPECAHRINNQNRPILCYEASREMAGFIVNWLSQSCRDRAAAEMIAHKGLTNRRLCSFARRLTQAPLQRGDLKNVICAAP